MKKRNKNIKDGSRHLLNYINKGDNCRAWDYGFLLGVIDAKLHDMEDFFSSDERTHLENWRMVHHQLQTVRRVLKYAMNEDVDTNITPYINKRTLDRDLLIALEHLEKDYSESVYFGQFVTEIRQKKALRLAFKLIGKHCTQWWD